MSEQVKQVLGAILFAGFGVIFGLRAYQLGDLPFILVGAGYVALGGLIAYRALR